MSSPHVTPADLNTAKPLAALDPASSLSNLTDVPLVQQLEMLTAVHDALTAELRATEV